ncbi:MAG: PAS domain-containing protein [Phormidesmis sp. CAN_BIN36]|nr:PAS domain-containing protein [Phormidesmis sp. CAN_BIN36]
MLKSHSVESASITSELLHLLIEQTPNAIAMLDRQMCYLLVSQRWLNDYRCDEQMILGRSHYEVLPNIPDEWRAVHQECLDNATEACLETQLQSADGLIWVRTKIQPWHDRTGKVGGLILYKENITQRKQIESELYKSQQLLQSVIDNANVTVFVKEYRHTDGTYILANQKFRTQSDLNHINLIGKTDHQLFPTEIAEAFRLVDCQVFTSCTLLQTEEIELHADGLHTSLVIKFPLFDSEGQPYAVAGLATDITERKQSEIALQQAKLILEQCVEERTAELQQLVEQLRQEIIERQAVLRDRERAEAQRQQAQEDLKEQLRLASLRAEIDSSLTKTGDLSAMLQRCTEIMTHHLGAAFVRIWTLNAEEQVLELQASAGMYTHIDGAHSRVAVGQFKIGLIALERQPHCTNAVLDDPRVGDKAWALREGMVAFAGYPLIVEDELLGVIAMFAHNSITDPTLDALAMVSSELALGIKRKQAEFALQQSEAQLRQQTQELEIALRDLKQTQAQLVQTEKMSGLGQLVAGVAHEINNPVNIIYGNVNHASGYVEDLLNLLQLYQTHYPNPAAEIQTEADAIDFDFLLHDLPKLLSSVKMGADRIRQIVLALRNFSRTDEAALKEVNIHEGIDSTLLILQNRLKGNPDYPEISVIKDYGKLPLVECYAGQLNQVFMNILSNAIDALTHQNPTIWIRTAIADRTLKICISDNGSGMPESVQRRLFEPFFTTKAVGKGTGLGLSISYQIIVVKHGGTLSCTSSPEQGTEFTIEIPVSRPTRSG